MRYARRFLYMFYSPFSRERENEREIYCPPPLLTQSYILHPPLHCTQCDQFTDHRVPINEYTDRLTHSPTRKTTRAESDEHSNRPADKRVTDQLVLAKSSKHASRIRRGQGFCVVGRCRALRSIPHRARPDRFARALRRQDRAAS